MSYLFFLATWQHFSSPVQLNIPETDSQTSRSWKNMRVKGLVFSTAIHDLPFFFLALGLAFVAIHKCCYVVASCYAWTPRITIEDKFSPLPMSNNYYCIIYLDADFFFWRRWLICVSKLRGKKHAEFCTFHVIYSLFQWMFAMLLTENTPYPSCLGDNDSWES